MSGTGPRESIFPTRMALTNTKTRLKGAQTGHSLLAKKRDALTTRFRAILKKVDEVPAYSPQESRSLLCSIVGKAEDGASNATCIILNGRSYICYWRHCLPCPGTSEIC